MVNLFLKHRKIIIAALIFFAGCLFPFTALYEPLEYKLYDAFLHIKPEPLQKDNIVILAIDDVSIEQIGSWPWSRDIVADMLIRLREVGAETVVFDIEYLNPGQLGVNPDYLREELPRVYAALENEVTGSVADFAQAVQSGNLPPAAALETGTEIVDYLQPLMRDVYTSMAANLMRDNDKYFADALGFFGNAYITVNAIDIDGQSSAKENAQYAREHFLFGNVADTDGRIKTEYERRLKKDANTYGISPALLVFLQNSAGAGFPNVEIDSDGSRRRIPLFSEFNGRYAAQLVLAPILNEWQPSRLIRSRRKLVLKDALVGENTRADVAIPLDGNGNLLINWVKTDFVHSFKSESAYKLYFIDKLERQLLDYVKKISQLGIKTAQGYLSYYDAATYVQSEYDDLQAHKKRLLDKENTDFDDYYAARRSFFADLGELVSGGFDTEIYAVFEAVRQKSNSPELFAVEQKNIGQLFAALASDYELYNKYFAELSGRYQDSFCILGYSGTGTTDLGVTPFQKSYPNVGTHANVYNTLMGGNFITPVPVWASLAILLALTIVLQVIFTRVASMQRRILYGVLALAFCFMVSLLLMTLRSVYVPVLPFLLPSLLLLIIFSFTDYFVSEKEKGFIRKAFSTYLSDSVVKEIISDPSKLTLGGAEKNITALFTDIRSFSTFSEKMTAPELVSLLNVYLTEMSDIILSYSGTIDKYIGDAIVAFFGAPVTLADHAARAVTAAIRMKQAEARLNERLQAAGELADPIFTRIGINTGKMVVGNMGTDAKMNYTIMGSDVNLAARLEGVNKVYGSGIIASEAAVDAAGDGFVFRKFDRIRVVGIHKPVEIFEVVGLREETPDTTLAGVKLFEQALEQYFAGDFGRALPLFEQADAVFAGDYAAKLFVGRCQNYLQTGVPDGWDGVSTLTSK